MAEPTTAFRCYVTADGVKGPYCGGSNDNTTAALIATTVYQLAQAVNPSNTRGVGVYDPSDELIAYIGRTPP